MADIRRSAEALGTILSAEPSEEQKRRFEEHIDRCRSSPGFLQKVINHPIQRYNGRTLVHIAADKGLNEYLETLLNEGGDPNKQSSLPDLCQTPLHLAAFQGYAKCLQVLVKHGAQIRVQNAHRTTPIDLVRGKTICESILQQAIGKVEIPNRTEQQLQRVMDLHRLIDQPREDMDTFVSLYSRLNSSETDLSTRWTDWFQQTLLYRATDKEHVNIVEFLLSKSPKQPLRNLGHGDTPLISACRHGNLKLVDLLIHHSPVLIFVNEEQNSLTPLHVSTSRGDKGIIQAMLHAVQGMYESGITDRDLNMTDKIGRTPFYNACYHGQLPIVQAFLDFKHKFPDKIDINAEEQSRRSPLHAAVSAPRFSKEILELLVKEVELKINVEGYPSSRSYKQLKRVLERKRSRTALHSPSFAQSYSNLPPFSSLSFDYHDSEDLSSNQDYHSDTPVSTLSEVSDDIDAEIGITKHESNQRASLMHSISLTNQIPAPPSPSSQIHIVFLNNKLEVIERGGENHTSFSKILLTPLAESCVFGSREIVELLINHGAKDINGYACQIAYLIRQPSLVHVILSRQCHPCEHIEDKPHPFPLYSLDWRERHLSGIDGKWFFLPLYSLDLGIAPFLDSFRCQAVIFNKVETDSLHMVYLQKNCLESVPLELFQLPNVTEINLSENKLISLPDDRSDSCSVYIGTGAWTCVHLTALILSSNNLQTLPTCLWFLPSLEILKASMNKLLSLVPVSDKFNQLLANDDSIVLGPNLKEIDVSKNMLREVDDFVFSLSELTKLYISNNNLQSLPPTLWDCSTLQNLDISHNMLSSLPKCDQQEDIREASFAIKSSPGIMQMATALHAPQAVFQNDLDARESIHWVSRRRRSKSRSRTTRTTKREDFKIHKVKGEVESEGGGEAIVEICDYSVLSRLNISHNKFKSFPIGLPCLAPNLCELDVSNNDIQIIDITYLPQFLRKLLAKHCSLERFGNTLTETHLNQVIRKCYHEESANICLHRAHSQLLYLQTIMLEDNKLKRFQLLKAVLKRNTKDPTEDELEYRQNVSALNLLYPSLEGLDLSNNCLVGTFNPNIGRQSQLKWLWLGSNKELEELPLHVAHLKNFRRLTEIRLKNLPNLVEPPREYQDEKVQVGQLLTYMRSRLKDSVPYRTLKLFFIGCGKRGKTTLLRRLRERQAGDTERTEGIDIEEWSCKGAKRRLFRAPQEPIQFLAWDFAGQEVYQVTHQCFYSRRAIYLALFRLSDGEEGIDELEPWLRNVQLRAEGCIVIIVGTYLDKVHDAEAQKLDKIVSEKFINPSRQGNSVYPKIVGCIFVSCVSKFKNNIDKLRQLIYEVSVHLQVSPKDGITLEYKKDLSPDSSYALLKQQIPKSFLQLQERVSDLVKVFNEKQRPPYLSQEEFSSNFLSIFDNDEEEMNEAVNYLTLQGTLLHFDDYGLRDLYFLDPQWLAKLMARLISPSSAENMSLIDGKILLSNLFEQDLFLHEHKAIASKYLQLLQKFEVALCIGEKEVIIPSLFPESQEYPKPNDSLKDLPLISTVEGAYQPPMRRIWFSNYIPDGFWPRLICRLLNDHLIKSILSDYFNFPEDDSETKSDWTCWKCGLVYVSRGRTLLIVRHVHNSPTTWDREGGGASLQAMDSKWRIEVHIYVPEMINVLQELRSRDNCQSEEAFAPSKVAGQATQLMVAISNHIAFLSSWFQGMLVQNQRGSGGHCDYVPCWKCYGGVEGDGVFTPSKTSEVLLIDVDGSPCVCLSFNSCIIPSSQEIDLLCSVHGSLGIVQTVPELAFWDLVTVNEDMEKPRTLRIIENEVLGKGGYGFVCKGELKGQSGSPPEMVAVKVFLANLENKIETLSCAELLEEACKDDQKQSAYKEIRQEVTFLSTLKHQNITRLIGVRTKPVYCLLLELAPMQSLRSMLKDYLLHKLTMEPITLKQCARQIADGLNYLHTNQIVHLDMKSPNVLVWEFPIASLPRQQRLEQAGNVWLKIADYGISQVATSLMMKVTTSQPGTPGYMAPELFETGQEIYSTKVDVFAYGMTLYEIISLQAPFHKQEGMKRNHEVRAGKRPPTGNKEKHTPLLLQDLMRLCWSKDPSSRPKMKECLQWTSNVEFERLRTQLTLGSCTAISCAAVSRVEPQHETEWYEGTEERGGPDETLRTMVNGTLLTREEIQRFGSDVDVLLSSQDSLEIEESIVKSKEVGGERETEEDEDLEEGRGLEPPPFQQQKRKEEEEEVRKKDVTVSSSSLVETKALTTGLLGKEYKEKQDHGEAYSQIWMCGRDQKKGLLSVFIFPDHQKTSSRFFGYIGKEEIQALCPIRNAMWVGTSLGNLRVIHAPSLVVKFSGKLSPGKDSSAILKILHVEEENCVLASLTCSQVWSLHDGLIGKPQCIVKEQCIHTNEREGSGPVYDLVKVVVDGCLQVWGTMDNNTLLSLEKRDGLWTTSYHDVVPYSHHMKVCSHIVWCSFEEEGRKCDYVWVSYRSKGGIVCYDVRNKLQKGHINCSERLKGKDDPDVSQQVTSLLAQGRRLYVGTLSGIVAVFDSESFGLITSFSWHTGKVRSLMLLPEQVKGCVCAEVPFASDDDKERARGTAVSTTMFKPSPNNPCCMQNSLSDYSLVASIGNGRLQLMPEGKTEPTGGGGDRSSKAMRRRTGAFSLFNEDINLLIWHS